MAGKKKNKTVQNSSSSTTRDTNTTTPPATDDAANNKLEQLTQQLKALSPNKNPNQNPTRASKPIHPHDGGIEQNGDEEKSREEVMEERKRKKAEAKAAKAQASAKSKEQKKTNPSLQQPQPKETQQSKAEIATEIADSPSTDDVTSIDSKPALRPSSAAEKLKEKNLQPGNNLEETYHPLKRKSKFTLATPTNVHPAFRRLAAKCETNKLSGVNELLIEFLHTMIEFVKDYDGEPDMSFKTALRSAIEPQLNCLSDNGAHPFPLAMGNLIVQFRKTLNRMDDTMNISETKDEVIKWLENVREENFDLAEKAIIAFTIQKLKSQSHRKILTYSRCPIVEQIILTAAEENLDLHVFVVDSPVGHQGKGLLEALNEQNIPCTYGQISAIGYLIEQVSIVLLGCSGILSNGRVVAPRGSSLLALCAQTRNLPVLVAAKTCTFVDKVRLDEHLSTALLSEPIETIPEDLVTALVTDLRILPPSSAPAVLKAKQLANED